MQQKYKRKSTENIDFVNALIKLTSMGYDEHAARLVLKKYNNDINAAINYFQIMPSSKISNAQQSHKSHNFTKNKSQPKHSNKHKHQSLHGKTSNGDIIDKMNYPYSHSVREHELCAGDHIYVWRTLYLYQHHGIYIGKGEVIHFSGEIINSKDAKIVKTSLQQFSKNDTIKRVQYGVNKSYFKMNRAGSCNQLNSDHYSIVIKRAKSKLGSCKGAYDLLGFNCETFCLWCKLGDRYENSNQSTFGYINVTTAMGVATGGMIAGPIGAAIGGVAVYTAAYVEKNHEKKLNAKRRQNKCNVQHKYNTNQKYTSNTYSALDSDQMKQLIGMGFDSTMAAQALETYNNDLNAAILCLLANSRKA